MTIDGGENNTAFASLDRYKKGHTFVRETIQKVDGRAESSFKFAT